MNSLIFFSIYTAMIIHIYSPYQCYLNTFPYVYGGTSGDTYFNTFAIDFISGNTAAGGNSSDTTIAGGSTTIPIIVLFSETGALSWAKTFSQTAISGASTSPISIMSMSMKVSGSTGQIAIAATNGNLFLFCLDEATGTQVRNYHADTGTTSWIISANSMIINSNYNYFLTGQRGGAWAVFMTGTASGSGIYAYTTPGQQLGRGQVIIFGETNSALYVGGMQQITSANQHQYTSLTRLIVGTNAMTMAWNYGFDNGPPSTTSTPFKIKHMDYNSGYSSITACAEQGGSSGQVQFIKVFINTITYAVISSTTYQTSDSSASYICGETYGWTTQMYVLIFDTIAYKFYYVYVILHLSNLFQVIFSGTNAGDRQTNQMTTFGGNSGSSLMGGYFVKHDIGYYSGSTKIVLNASPTVNYSYRVGYVMSISQDFTCFPISLSLGTVTTLTSETSLTSQPFAISSISITDQTGAPTTSNLGTASVTSAGTITCPANTYFYITVQALTDVQYIVKSATLTTVLPPCLTSYLCIDYTMVYSMLQSTSNLAVPSYITLDPSSQTLSVYTTNNNNVGTVSITITCYIEESPSNTNTNTMTVTLISSCNYATTIAPSISPQTYVVTQAAMLITPAFTNNDTDCPVTYTLTNSDGSAIDSTIFTFTASSNQLSISTSDVTKRGTYSFKNTGTITGYTQTSNVIFTLTIQDCSSVTSPPIPNVNYVVSSGTTTIATLSWRSVYTCSQSFTYVVQNQANGGTVPSSVTLSGTTLSITQTDHTIVGTFLLEVVGTLGAYGTATQQFTLTISNDCSTNTLTPSSISSQSYTIGSASPLVFTFTAWTSAYSGCSTIIYTADETSPTVQSLPPFVTFSGTSRQFTISSTSQADIGTYTIQVTGTSSSVTQTTTFQLIMVDPCLSAVVTAGSVTIPQTYYINDASLSISFTFTSTVASQYCGAFSYIMKASTDGGNTYGGADASVFTFSPASIETTIYSTDVSKAMTYWIKIIATQGSYTAEQGEALVELYIINRCTSTVITASTISDQTYTIGQSALVITFSSFTESVGTCGSFTYTSTLSSGAVLPSFITLDSVNDQYTVSSSSIADVGTDTIILTGTLSSYGFKTITFVLTVSNPCISLSITPSSVSSQVYYVGDSSLSITITDFTTTGDTSICGSITYSIEQSLDSGSTYTNVDSSIYTFTSGSSSQVLSVQTSDTSTINTYQIKVTGSQGGYASANVVFSVQIENQCTITVISTTAISDVSYVIGASTFTLTFSSFTSSISSCGAFTYSATLSSSSSLPSCITLDSSTEQFQIYSTDINDASIYDIQLIGALGTYGSSSISFQVTITNPCPSLTVAVPTITSADYYITQSAYQFLVSAFTSSVSTSICGVFTYTIQQSTGGSPYGALDSSLFTFTDSVSPMLLSVSTSDPSEEATYTIMITGQVGLYNSGSTTFDVNVLSNCYIATITSSSPTSQTYTIGDTALVFTFNAFTDSVGTCGAFTYTSSMTSPTVDSLPTFITFDSTARQYSVYSSTTTDAGAYTISIIGTLSTYQSQTITIDLTVYNSCVTLTITPSSVLSQVYYIGDSSLSITIPAFTTTGDISICGSITYAIEQSLDNGVTYTSIDSTIFTFSSSSSSPTLSVQTSDYSTIQNYQIEVTGSQGSYGSANLVFNVQIENECTIAVISTTAISDVSYVVGASTLTITFSSFTNSVSSCGSFAYFATLSSGSSLPSCITFDSVSQQFLISTSDINDASIYGILLTGTLGSFGSSSVSFQVTITNPCLSLTVTAPTITSGSYYITDTAYQFSIQSFTSSVSTSICGDFIYTIQQSTGGSYGSIDSTLFTFTDSTSPMILTVSSSNPSEEATYTILITGQVGLYNSGSTTFDVNVLSNCYIATITSSSPTSQTYTIGDSALVFTFNAFTDSVGTCGIFTYSSIMTSPSTGSLPTFITFDSTNRQYSVYSSTTTDAGTYTISITGTLSIYQSQTITFDLTVYNSCVTLTITPSSVLSQVYYVGDSSLSITIPAFTTTGDTSICGSITYAVLQSLDNGVTYTNIDSTIFTFSSSSSSPILSTQTSDYSTINTYQFMVTGSEGLYGSSNMVFTVQIENKCTIAVVSTTSVSNVNYILSSSSLPISIPQFTSSISSCGLFTYSIQQSTDGGSTYSSLDSTIFTFTDSSSPMILAVSTSDSSNQQTYTIQIIGQLGIYASAQLTFSVTIISNCYGALIYSSSLASQVYNIGASTKVFSFSAFTDSVGTCGTITYSSSITSPTTESLPSFITFDSTNRQFSVLSSSIDDVGVYTIEVTGSLSAYGLSNEFTFTLSVLSNVSPCISATLTPASSIGTQYYQVGATQLSIQIQDFIQSVSDNECGSITYSAIQSNGTTLDPSIFTLVTSPIVALNVYTVNALTLNYTIEITGKYTAFPAVTNSLQFMVCITQASLFSSISSSTSSKASTSSSNENVSTNQSTSISSISSNSSKAASSSIQKQSSSSSSIQSSSSSFSITYNGSWTPTNKTWYNLTLSNLNISNPQNLYAYFEKITTSATAIVKFSQNIQIPTNYQSFDDSILQLIYIPFFKSSNVTLNSWVISTFTNSQMEIALNFSDPLLVSVSDGSADKLYVSFVQSQYFQSISTSQTVEHLQLIQSQVPAQLSASNSNFWLNMNLGDVKVLKTLQSTVSSSMTIISSAILPLQFLLQAGLSQLWGLINSLQLLMTLPTLQIAFPANAQTFFSFFVQITTFQFYDPTPIIAKATNVSVVELNNAPQSIQNLGMNSTNIFINMATYVVTFLLIGVMTAFVKQFKKFQFRRYIFNKINSYLYATFVYSSILRSLVEGYFFFAISILLGASIETSTPSEIIATAFALVCLSFLVVLPIYFTVFLYINKNKLEEERFQDHFISLYQDLNTVGKGLYYNPIFMLRRLILAATIVYLQDYGSIQLIIFLESSILYLIYSMFCNVFKEPFMLYMDLFNEYIFTTSVYMSFCFSGFDTGTQLQNATGWMLVGVLMFSIVINFAVIINQIVREIRFKIKSIRHKRKAFVKQKLQEVMRKKFLSIANSSVTKPGNRIRPMRFAKMAKTRGDVSFVQSFPTQFDRQTEYEEMKITSLWSNPKFK